MRSSLNKQASLALTSQMEPKRINDAMKYKTWTQEPNGYFATN